MKFFSSERLNAVRDIFLFSCYTGLAYADVKKLKKSDLFIGIDGYQWIHCARKKMERDGSTSNIPLLPVAEEIVNRYHNHPECIKKGLVLLVKSNQKMNEYLKEIGDICEINHRMIFHLARHIFATTVTLFPTKSLLKQYPACLHMLRLRLPRSMHRCWTIK